MADHAVDDDLDGDIFIYRGGRAPRHVVTHVRIDRSQDKIEDNAFYGCPLLEQVDTHDGLRKIGKWTFCGCISLRKINLKSAVEIDERAFFMCDNLADAEFGDRLETIGIGTFSQCTSLKHLKLPSIITIGPIAFNDCKLLADVEFSERLVTIGRGAFSNCKRLRRIAMPLKRDLFEFSDMWQRWTQFDNCEQLKRVDIVGGVHETVASLHMESWKTEMISEINRINQVLPDTPADDKAGEIREWMDSVIDEFEHYKSEHCRYVKEGITLLELALWKAKLCEKEDERKTKKAKIDAEIARKERRVTCGADMVIKNVLPFLQLD